MLSRLASVIVWLCPHQSRSSSDHFWTGQWHCLTVSKDLRQHPIHNYYILWELINLLTPLSSSFPNWPVSKSSSDHFETGQWHCLNVSTPSKVIFWPFLDWPVPLFDCVHTTGQGHLLTISRLAGDIVWLSNDLRQHPLHKYYILWELINLLTPLSSSFPNWPVSRSSSDHFETVWCLL